MNEHHACHNPNDNTETFHEKTSHIRNRLADSALIIITILGGPFLLISLLRYIFMGGFLLFIFHLILYLTILTSMFFRKNLGYRYKTFLIIGSSVFIAVLSLLKWGLIGSGIPFFIFGSIFFTIFWGLKPGALITGANLIFIIVLATLYQMGLLQYNFPLDKYAHAIPSWVTAAAGYGFFTTILVFILGRLFHSMDETIENLRIKTAQLQEIKLSLENEIQYGEKARTALKESEERFKTVLENLPACVTVHDLDGKHLLVNDKICEVTGFSSEEYLAATVMDLAGPEFDWERIKKMWHEMEPGTSMTFFLKSKRKDGTHYDSEVHLTSIILEGRPVILSLIFDVTERKKAEDALKNSEIYLRTLVNTIPDIIWLKGEHGRYLYCNSRFEDYFEADNNEIIERSDYDFFNRELADTLRTNDIESMEKGALTIHEEAIINPVNGKKDIFETIRTPMYWSDGNFLGILGISRDITARKKLEETLARRSKLERMISRISSGLIGICHDEIDSYIHESLAEIGKLTGVDHAYICLFSQDEGSPLKINEWRRDSKVPEIEAVKDLELEDDMPWLWREIQTQGIAQIPDVEALPPEAQKEKIFLSSEGIKSYIAMPMWRGDQAVGFFGFDTVHGKKTWSDEETVLLRIIGESFTSSLLRKRMEEKQKKLQAQLATAVDLAHLGTWEFDIPNNRFIFNDHFFRIYRTTAEETGGYTMTPEEYTRRFVHPHDIDSMLDAIHNGFDSEAPLNNRVEHRMIYSDGSTGYLMSQIFLERNSRGKPVKAYGVNQDITEWKEAQERLRESEERLARSRKMESLGLLAGGVAHDLNNVLSGIVSYPELLLMDLPEDSKMRKSIETIQKSGEKAVAIVQDLLTIARGVITVKKPININDAIEEYLHSPEFRRLEEYHPLAIINKDLEPDLFNIKGSPIHIKKVIMNLVSNAAEAIDGSGNINISTKNIYLDKPVRGYDNVKAGEYIILSVSDNGPGIKPDNLERIFEPFFSKKVMGTSGTGLGLTVVWNTVQDHSGYIDVASGKNGTQFDLYFPITRDDILENGSSVQLESIKGRGEKILVVDDMENQIDISCRMLEILGYEHASVTSGEKAVSYLKENSADLIMLDMIMDPGISGREAYEQIVKMNPKQKAVIVSGFSETEDVLAIQKLGAGRYIKKPFSIMELGAAIKEELSKDS